MQTQLHLRAQPLRSLKEVHITCEFMSKSLRNLHKPKNLPSADACRACRKHRETFMHCFAECEIPSFLWSKITPLIQGILNTTNSLKQPHLMLGDLSEYTDRSIRQRKLTTTLIAHAVYVIWTTRCRIFHENSSDTPIQTWQTLRRLLKSLINIKYQIAKQQQKVETFKEKFLINSSLGEISHGTLITHF